MRIKWFSVVASATVGTVNLTLGIYNAVYGGWATLTASAFPLTIGALLLRMSWTTLRAPARHAAVADVRGRFKVMVEAVVDTFPALYENHRHGVTLYAARSADATFLFRVGKAGLGPVAEWGRTTTIEVFWYATGDDLDEPVRRFRCRVCSVSVDDAGNLRGVVVRRRWPRLYRAALTVGWLLLGRRMADPPAAGDDLELAIRQIATASRRT